MHREQRGHDGEPTSDNDGAGVSRPSACGRQRNRGDHCNEGADTDAIEVNPGRRHDHLVADKPQQRHRQDSATGDHGND